ncbi:MAG: hypothetical protein RBS80_12535 [Thermoguttaceae bacterium]|jgi:hypothetical protein|nr:hypothetical protein [Thermoguttaceae bacterium]
MSPKTFASSIVESIPRNALVFSDTNFYSCPVDFVVWDAILTRRLVIPPLVWTELQPWISSPHHNQEISKLVDHAYQHGHAKIEFLHISDDYREHGFEHYFSLLSYRKQRGVEIYDQFCTRRGRAPTDIEFQAECQTQCGSRGSRLAYKGWQDRGKMNRFADEELVVLAVQTAILRGVDVAILSRDLDVEEQFLKLLGFLQHDYTAMLVAEEYASHPDKLQFMPGKWPPFQGYVEDEEMLVWKTTLATVDRLRPAQYRIVDLHSVVVGNHPTCLKVTPLSFRAETAVRRLLVIKNRSGGLNTDRLGGRNCRLGSIKNTALVVPVICRDKMIPLGSTYVPALDERFAASADESVAPV